MMENGYVYFLCHIVFWIRINDSENIRISVDVAKSSDPRPEKLPSEYRYNKYLSEPISTDNNWHLRKQLVLPLVSPSLCCLREQRHNNGYPTLGIIKPKKINRFIIESDEKEWTLEELAKLHKFYVREYAH
jgi:hypothetical protein